MGNTIILPSSNGGLPSAPNELGIDPCGGVKLHNKLPDYPRYIRNGTFKSTVNGTLFVPATAGAFSNIQITHGWYIKQNGSCVMNADVATLTTGATVKTNASHRQLVSIQSVGGTTADFCILEQRTSNIDVFSGKPVALQFDAYVLSGAEKIGVEFIYDDDSGGAFTINGGTFDLTEQNQTFTIYPGIPALSDSGLGTDARMMVRWWIQAGSDFDGRFGENINSTAGNTFYFSNIRDGSILHEPNEPEEEESGSTYFYKDSIVRFIGAGASTGHTSTAAGYFNWPVPLARVPLVSEITLTTANISGITITPDRYGFGIVGTATDVIASARILTLEVDITPPS